MVPEWGNWYWSPIVCCVKWRNLFFPGPDMHKVVQGLSRLSIGLNGSGWDTEKILVSHCDIWKTGNMHGRKRRWKLGSVPWNTERSRKVTNSTLGSHFFRRHFNKKQALTLSPFYVASHGPLPAHGAILIQLHFVLSPAFTCVFTDKIEPGLVKPERGACMYCFHF